MKKFKDIFLFLLSFGFLGAVTAGAVEAASLSLSPSFGTHETGDTFTVDLKVDTGGEGAMTVDSVIKFDSTRLEVSSVSAGSFMTDMQKSLDNGTGSLTIYNFSSQPLTSAVGGGVLASIVFKAKAAGTASVTFVCEAGAATDSSVWNVAAEDILTCGSIGSGSYTISGVAAADAVDDEAEPTTSVAAATATPSELPETGNEWVVVGALFLGIMLFVGGAFFSLI